MNCQECELLLAEGERNPGVESHLSRCADCRTLAAELEANSEALERMRDDVVAPRHRPRWIWIAAGAAAAAVMLAVGLSQVRPATKATPAVAPIPIATRAEPPEIIPVVPAPPEPVRARRPLRKQPPAPIEASEPLLVKMLTPDPDVVIYWLIEPKEGLL